MKLDFVSVLRDAWRLFRRDHDVLVRVAAMFVFLPSYALALLVPEPPLPERGQTGQAATFAWAERVSDWAAANGGWYCLAYAIGFLGAATLSALYLMPGRPVLRDALRQAFGLLPRVLLAMVLVSLASGAGLLLWVIPGLYVLGRLMLAMPVLVAERPVGAGAAIVRSVRLTRGQGLATMGLASFTVLSGWLGAQPFLLIDQWMTDTGAADPIGRALVDAGAAAAAALAALAQALVAVAVYRRLARNGT